MLKNIIYYFRLNVDPEYLIYVMRLNQDLLLKIDFVSRSIKFCQDACRILNIPNSFKTTYHLHTIGQEEHYSCTLRAAVRNHLNDYSSDWDLYPCSLSNEKNCVPHTSIAIVLLEPILSRQPSLLALESNSKRYTYMHQAK